MEPSPCSPNVGPAGDIEIEPGSPHHKDGNNKEPAPEPVHNVEVTGDSSGPARPIGNFVSVEPNRQLYLAKLENDRASEWESGSESESEYHDCLDESDTTASAEFQFHDLPDQIGVRVRRKAPPLAPNVEPEEEGNEESDSQESGERDYGPPGLKLMYVPFKVLRNLTPAAVGYDHEPLKFTKVWSSSHSIYTAGLKLENLTTEYLTYKASVSCPKNVQVDSLYGFIEPRASHTIQLTAIQDYLRTTFEDNSISGDLTVYTAPVSLIDECRRLSTNWDQLEVPQLVDFWDTSLHQYWWLPPADVANVQLSCDDTSGNIAFKAIKWCLLRTWGSEERIKELYFYRSLESISDYYKRKRVISQMPHKKSRNWKEAVQNWWERSFFWPDLGSFCKLFGCAFVFWMMMTLSPADHWYREIDEN